MARGESAGNLHAMSVTIGLRELRERLEEFLGRAGRGERIVVRPDGGEPVVLGPAGDEARREDVQVVRRRYRSERTVAEVMAEDRGT